MSTAEKWKNRGEIRKQARIKGEEIFGKIQEKLKGLKPEMLIVINTTNGEYLVGENEKDLMIEFQRRFGQSDIGWMREIGGGK